MFVLLKKIISFRYSSISLQFGSARIEHRLWGIAKLLGSDCEGLAKAVSCRHFGGVICPEAEGIVAGVAV